MPQADILSFHPTMLFLPLCFLGGYFFFVTQWVPRILLTLKARAWLTQFETRTTTTAVFLVGTDFFPSTGWPELFLMFIQFGGLLYFVSGLTLVVHPDDQGLQPLRYTPPATPTFDLVGGLPVENFFLLWGTYREEFLFRPGAVELTHLVDKVLGGFGFFAPGKQFPLLSQSLRTRLVCEAQKMSELSEGASHG